MRKYEDLRHIQRVSIQHIVKNEGSMLALAMGFGKSIISLTAVRELLDTFQSNHVLVIAPLLVAEEVWPEEIESWEHTSCLSYEVLTGPAERREQRAKRLPEVSIVNVENVVWLVEFWGDNWPYDTVIIDEISRFKNPSKKTKPSKLAVEKCITETLASLPADMPDIDKEIEVKKALKKIERNLTRFGALASVRGYIDRVVGLTGTPAPNGLLDLWSQYYLLDRGDRLGSNIHAYQSRYFQKDYTGFKYVPRPGSFERIVERISDITISMKTEDYVDMPPIINNVIKVKLPPKVLAQYKEFVRTLNWEEHDIEAVNAGVLTGKCLQLCIAGGTEVLCRRGWVPIENISSIDEVWDGVEFVSTKGVKYNGKSSVVDCYGVYMTGGHRVLTEAGWLTAEEILNGKTFAGLNREKVRLPDGYGEGWDNREQSSNLAMPVRLREEGGAVKYVLEKQEPWSEEILRVSAWGDACGRFRNPRYDKDATVRNMAGFTSSLPEPKEQGLQKLRRTWDRYAGLLVQLVRGVLGGCEVRILGRSFTRSDGQQCAVLKRELPLVDSKNSASEHQSECARGLPLGPNYHRGSSGEVWSELRDTIRQAEAVRGDRAGVVRPREEPVEVYDLVDCGPRNRFVVRGDSGPLIVHNCNGSMYREDGTAVEIHSLKLDALDCIIEEAAGAPVLVAYSYQFDLEKLRKKYPQAEVVGESPNVQKRWNAGEIPILLAHPASAGHGMNLQHGGSIMVWYGLNWSLELYQQMNKRLHRPGQKETVVIHHIVAEDTVDERVMKVLPEKDATQDALIEATKYRP